MGPAGRGAHWRPGRGARHAGEVRRPTLSPTAYRRITLFALLALGFIVVTGAAVRLTGSGLGCPTWPNCEPGRLTPRHATSYHAYIEFGNRLITGLVSVAVILAVLGAMFRVPRRRDLVWWSWSLVAGVIAQIVLGGLTVLFELAPPFVMGHFLLSAVLVACAVILHHRAGEPDAGHRRPVATPEVRLLGRFLAGAGAIVLLTGTAVTGSGPHGGDADVQRLHFFLPDITRVHSLAVWALLATTVWTLVLVRRGGASPTVERALRTLVALEVAQGAIGYTQYFTGVPEGLVLAHIVGAMLVWGAALEVSLRTSVVEPAALRAPQAAQPAASGV